MIESARRLLERERAAGRAWIVYLRCSVDELKRRLRAAPGDRPGLTGGDPIAEVAAVLAVREPTYRALADLVLPADELAMDETAAAIEWSLQRPRTG
jgi:shikimate kinase